MNKIFQSILNIAAGKFMPLELNQSKHYHVINLDTMYFQANSPEKAEENLFKTKRVENTIDYCNSDAYEFMERTKLLFDRVCIYRFLEHVPMDKVLYFIYLVSCVTKTGAEVDVIVPNYWELARMLLEDDPYRANFDKKNVILTTELLNEPSCPHALIWTEPRARYFWELEDRFKVKVIFPRYKYDGRDIYLRFKATRI